jgi:hypothetical protein
MRAKASVIAALAGVGVIVAGASAGPTKVRATRPADPNNVPVGALMMGPDGPGFSDNFNSYPAGPLVPQGGWQNWNGVGGPLPGSQNATIVGSGCYPDCDGGGTLTVSDFGCFQTAFVAGCGASNKYADSVVETDVVQTFNITPTTNPTGKWRYSADVYIPSTQVGDGWFILLNTFVGPPFVSGNWSVQVRFNTAQVISDFGAQTTPSIVDQWVPIVCDIDLLADTLNISYGGTQFVFNAVYSQNVSGLGTTNIQCLDLYSTAAGFRWDNVALTPMP